MANVEREASTPHLETKCCACDHAFRIRPSLSMQMGINSGHVSCPKCKEFLHVEILEGNAAWTERWTDYVQRECHGAPIVAQHAEELDRAHR